MNNKTAIDMGAAVGTTTVTDVKYGVFLDLGDSRSRNKLMLGDARSKIEIAVRFDGETKEFAFSDFALRLGMSCKGGR